MGGCTRVCCSVVCFSVWRKKRTEQRTLVQPPTQQKRQHQNRALCPSRQTLSERPQSGKILNRNIIKINYGCMNNIKKDHRQTHFKFIQTHP